MRNNRLILIGLLLVIVPLGLGLAITLLSMLSTLSALSQGTNVDTGDMANGIMWSLLHTALAIPFATVGLICVVVGKYPRGK